MGHDADGLLDMEGNPCPHGAGLGDHIILHTLTVLTKSASGSRTIVISPLEPSLRVRPSNTLL